MPRSYSAPLAPAAQNAAIIFRAFGAGSTKCRDHIPRLWRRQHKMPRGLLHGGTFGGLVVWDLLLQTREGLEVEGFREMRIETFFTGAAHVFRPAKTCQSNCRQVRFARQLS